eukprot:scaffold56227_cov39-Phaeocystis_antarctica.AAC.2
MLCCTRPALGSHRANISFEPAATGLIPAVTVCFAKEGRWHARHGHDILAKGSEAHREDIALLPHRLRLLSSSPICPPPPAAPTVASACDVRVVETGDGTHEP